MTFAVQLRNENKPIHEPNCPNTIPISPQMNPYFITKDLTMNLPKHLLIRNVPKFCNYWWINHGSIQFRQSVFIWLFITPQYNYDVINGNTFRATGSLCEELIDHRTKASDAELWCFLWTEPEQTAEQTIETPVILDAIALIIYNFIIPPHWHA